MNKNFLSAHVLLSLVGFSFSIGGFASEGIITQGIIRDLGKVDPLSEGVINGAEITRLSFALGRLSGEDQAVLRSLKVNGESYQFTLSTGVTCLVQAKDLQVGHWRPSPLNVADVPVPVGSGGRLGTGNQPLLLKPCLTP